MGKQKSQSFLIGFRSLTCPDVFVVEPSACLAFQFVRDRRKTWENKKANHF
jgi:hypothetical protein